MYKRQALAKAGAPVYHAGKVGADGQMLIDILGEYGVDASLVAMTQGHTGHAIIQVDKKGQNCILLYGCLLYTSNQLFVGRFSSQQQ